MLRALRQRFNVRTGRLMILLLALSLWPMASFGAIDCCPEDEAVVEMAESSNCHESAVAGPAGEKSVPHATCDADCAARCATPSLLLALAVLPAALHGDAQRAPWHAAVPPRPRGARLLRPPIHA